MDKTDSTLLDEMIAWTSADVSPSLTKLHVMARLFGKNRLQERAEKIATSDVQWAIDIVGTWHHDYHHGSLKKDKETSREQQYNQDFFIKILGYREKPATPFTFEPKSTTVEQNYPDALLGHTDAAAGIVNVSAVVELKGAAIDLDKPQQGHNNRSPVEQAFGYKTQYRSCPFVVVSNFYEFRLYNDNRLDREVWTLDELVDPADDYLKFKTWYVLLHADNFTAAHGKSDTELLLSDIRLEQEDISEKFYTDYKFAREELLRDIWRRNPKARGQFDRAIEKAQTVIDRVVFACFAEDSGLLPDNIVARVEQYAESSPIDEEDSLWSWLKRFFSAINSGSEKLGIPQGYNGGLFAEDKALNALEISDAPLKRLLALTKYGFVEDLTVTILGHIFEQSITDLEALKREIHNDENLFEKPLPEPKVGKRKKEGIFYTPDYIVRYIVDNTLGEYLRRQEDALKVKHKLNERVQAKEYEKRQRNVYLDYQYVLQNIKVLDPACGSGAFLVYVFSYLLAENQRVDAILGGGLYSYDEYIRNILSDNIFGVDLNEESVEITKLSLWLATAEKGKKLTALDATIRNGNSLVDDVKIVGDSAFAWDEQFPEVMKNGGFDVIVGNPPYVRSRDNVLDEIDEYVRSHYETVQEKVNLYLLFMERSLQLVKDGGWFGFVVPNSWLGMESARKTRELLLNDTSLHSFVNLVGESFPKVNVETVIFTLQKKNPEGATVKFQTVAEQRIEVTDYEVVPQARWLKTQKLIIDLKSKQAEHKLMDRLDGIKQKFKDRYEPRVGLQAYETGKGTPVQSKEDVKNHIYDYDHKFDDDTYRYLAGGDVGRYKLLWSGLWMRWGIWLSQPKELRYFTGPRVLIREISGVYPHVLNAVYTDEPYLNNKSILNLLPVDESYSLKFAVALLNSKVMGFYHQRRASKGNRTLFPKIVNDDLKNYPLPGASSEVQATIGALVDEMQVQHAKLLSDSAKFNDLLKAEFGRGMKSRTVGWWRLPFDEFLTVMQIKGSMAKKDELREVFDKYQGLCTNHTEEVRRLDAALDKAVYGVFSLDDDEIALVETNS